MVDPSDCRRRDSTPIINDSIAEGVEEARETAVSVEGGGDDVCWEGRVAGCEGGDVGLVDGGVEVWCEWDGEGDGLREGPGGDGAVGAADDDFVVGEPGHCGADGVWEGAFEGGFEEFDWAEVLVGVVWRGGGTYRIRSRRRCRRRGG